VGSPCSEANFQNKALRRKFQTIDFSTIKDSSLREIPFNGVRLRFDSNKSFDDVLSSLLADVGDKPLLINKIAANCESWDSYKKEV
jgi:hypothetical protein